MRLVTIVGARPQFIKASPLSTELRKRHQEVLVHTGQHYDPELSQVFFDELGLPTPDHHLGVGSGSHGKQTGLMLTAIEELLQRERPDAVVVSGDTNSTLAGALAAAKLGLPVAHVEAGLRSFNRAMPEELNRVIADHLATWLFAPAESSRTQLAREGIARGVHVVGDVMADAIRMHGERAKTRSTVLDRLGLKDGGYYLATVHRAENTDDEGRLRAIFSAFAELDRPTVLPLHPRTRRRLEDLSLRPAALIRLVEPQGYLDALRLLEGAACLLTDSGGMQKEAYYLARPCVTLRDDTEWTETIDAGWNVLAGADAGRIVASVRAMTRQRAGSRPSLYGDGYAARRIAAILAGDDA
jgi:UDP-GlcNAc3NAcA epimerase